MNLTIEMHTNTLLRQTDHIRQLEHICYTPQFNTLMSSMQCAYYIHICVFCICKSLPCYAGELQ